MLLLGRRMNISGINQRGLAWEWAQVAQVERTWLASQSVVAVAFTALSKSAHQHHPFANRACAIRSLPHAPVKVSDMMTYFPAYPSREKLQFRTLDSCQRTSFSSYPFTGSPWSRAPLYQNCTLRDWWCTRSITNSHKAMGHSSYYQAIRSFHCRRS